MRAVAIAAILVLLGSWTVQTQTPTPARGTLERGDSTLRSGEYYDEHSFTGQAGQQVTIDLTSSSFDPYVVIIAPSGERKENDDWEGSNRRSHVEMTLSESGRYRVLVTSYKSGETGAYDLRTTMRGGVAVAATPGRRVESGRLASGDRTLSTGEFYDEFTFQGRTGDAVTIDLRSSAFDPYLVVVGPASVRKENDDYEGDRQRSLVSFDLPQGGTYRVLVTSYAKDESGAYDLNIHQPVAAGRGGTVPVSSNAGPRVERGRLESGDRTIRSGEFMDTYTFEGRPGQRVTLDLTSPDFDTYLIMVPAKGDQQENDDVDDRRGHSRIEADITELGTYRVLVTSYGKGESGNYELRVDLGSAPELVADSASNRSRDLVPISYGDSQTGWLETSDTRIQSGEYRDAYAFDGLAGQHVVVELTSSEFDPYLVLTPPEGEAIDNDDAGGRLDLSRIDLTLPANGRYRVLVTSYSSGETGSYLLTVREEATATASTAITVPARSGGPRPPAAGARGTAASATSNAGARGRTFGVFIGISEYPDPSNNLDFTADDARRMQSALLANGMRPADSALLLDRQATRAGMQRAIENVARQATPDDTFVFFYSGHGGREARSMPQAAEADGQDETLALYDAEVSDDEMATWLSGVRAKFSLIVLDSCFSGGFQKDLITAPFVRMGLFSSEEDVLSSIATKFEAGGYLAHFFAEAIADRRGDLDEDGQITAIELSQYLRERYRSDVKSTGADDDDFVSVGGRRLGYQHLVVDRGGVRPNDVLFRLP